MVTVDLEYISAGCNRTPHALDWGTNGIICYSSCRAIVLYKQKDDSGFLSATFSGHQDRVSCCRWIKKLDGGPEDEFISSSADHTAIIWKEKNGHYVAASHLKGHTGSISVADAIYIGHESTSCHLFAATVSMDSTLKIWERLSPEECNCIQTISFANGFGLEVKFSLLPLTKVPLLACSTDDAKIHLFVEEDHQFKQVHSLLGHEDWIRSLDFAMDDNGILWLASGGQDSFIRIWKIEVYKEDSSPDVKITLKKDIFSVTKEGELTQYSVTLEAVVAGHENWIYGVHWQPQTNKEMRNMKTMKLLSASMDKTMIIWSYDETSGLWLEEIRVGEMGGNTLGFYGNKFSPDGNTIIAYSYQGAFHLWHYNKVSSSWLPGVTVGGHFNEVHDVVWNPKGNFVISTSLDQTTRLHAQWIRQNHKTTWHEIARPQIHGYDITCLAIISSYMFVSGGDEKVLRVFEAPRRFIENLGYLSAVDVSEDIKMRESNSIPEGASVPALSLSNKAIFNEDLVTSEEVSKKNPYSEPCFVPCTLSAPPTEENLLQNTLWPETQKLYGHGYEVFSVASNSSGTLIASACKASKAEDAEILLWNTSTWRIVCRLPSHSLTVTDLSFSPNDKYLLSVSRDRTWTVFKAQEDGYTFCKIAQTEKSRKIHTRIIWSCSWSPDSEYFVTGSRDKKVAIWCEEETTGKYIPASPPKEMESAVTSVAFAAVKLEDQSYLLGTGLESGAVYLFKWSPVINFQEIIVNSLFFHHLAVKRLRFCPKITHSENHSKELKLASCGEDFAVHIYKITINEIYR